MFAVLHLAQFALQAVLRATPGLAAQPVALFDELAKKSVVRAVNASAQAAGVDLGMNAPQALARCAGLRLLTPLPAAETECRATLHAVAFTLAPSVEDTAPGVCTIDVRGVAPDRREENARRAVAQLAAFGLTATAGLARTPLLALYAARATSGVQLVAPADEKAFLAPLPLSVTEATPALREILRHWGLATCGDLTALPRDDLIRRFGAEGLALWQRATGGQDRPLTPVIPAQTFTAGMAFESALESLEPLLFILNRCLERLTLELNTAHFVAAEIQLGLTLENERTLTLDFRLPEPTSRPEILFRALHTRLESLQTEAAIAALTLTLTPVRPLVRQQGMFETGLRDPHGFAETLARLSALVGPANVGTPQPEPTHRPDAVKLLAPPAVVPPPLPPPVHAPLSLPLRRLRPPVPTRLELVNGAPAYLWSEYVSGEILRRSPAYRASGEWWQSDRQWQRTEWDIELAGGGLYRLLRVGDAWWLEGEYD